jgi:hypothetical protein
MPLARTMTQGTHTAGTRTLVRLHTQRLERIMDVTNLQTSSLEVMHYLMDVA